MPLAPDQDVGMLAATVPLLGDAARPAVAGSIAAAHSIGAIAARCSHVGMALEVFFIAVLRSKDSGTLGVLRVVENTGSGANHHREGEKRPVKGGPADHGTGAVRVDSWPRRTGRAPALPA